MDQAARAWSPSRACSLASLRHHPGSFAAASPKVAAAVSYSKTISARQHQLRQWTVRRERYYYVFLALAPCRSRVF